MLKNSISAKIFFTVVSIIIVGFGFLTYTVIEQEKKDSLKERRSASELMAHPILYTIYKDMLDERADMVRHLIENMKDVKGTERVQIIRSNGIEEAFQDFKTLKAVEKEYGDLKPEWTAGHPSSENNVARGVNNPRFKEAMELFNKGRKEDIHYIEEADGKPLFTYLTPIEFRPKCNACHSAEEEARGILMISTSLEEMYATLASIRMRWILYAFFTISGSGILLILFIKDIIKPLRRLSDAATDIASGNYDISIPVKSGDEIGIVADSFNSMARQIKNRTKLLIEENVRAVKAEEAARESRKKYEMLINSLDGIVWEADPSTFQFTFVSKQAERLLGYPVEQWLNEPAFWKDHLHPDDREQAVSYCIACTAEGRSHEFEYRMIAADGRFVWLRDIVSVISTNNQAVNLYGLLIDITERRKLEEQLMHSQKMESIGQLAGGVAHDFNNILTAILGYGNLLLSKRGADDLVKEYVDEILSSANRAAILTRDLLSFSRKRIINLQPANLNEFIERVKKTLTRLLSEHIKINTNLSNKDLIVKMDITQIEHVLLNLATNARDAMPNGGTITITASPVKLDKEFVNTHHYGKPGNYALITFADTGIGIDKNIQPRIFEPFFTTKGVGKGTGLGLSMVYGIIKQHDGYINVYSEPGITVFKIYLPLMIGEVSAAEQKQLDAVVLMCH